MKTRTYTATPKTVMRAWHLVDVSGVVLGQAAPKIAKLLIGKHKPTYTPNIECGDYVVVVQSEKIVVTGNKSMKKMYYRHSGIPGGLHEETFQEVMKKDPTRIIYHAVRGMLPKNKMLDPRMHRLKVFTGSDHTYQDKFKKA